MSSPAPKPIIFISYADADEPEMPADGDIKWLSFVTGHLRPAENIGAFEIWTEPLVADGDLDPVEEKAAVPKGGTSGSNGTRSACAADRGARPSSSPACRRMSWTRGPRRRTPGSRPICRRIRAAR